MKLTVPLPQPEPHKQSEASQPTSVEPIQTSPAEPATQKTASWPAWFAGADFLLVALALSLAFLVSSFVARNSDVWLHLAAGKRLFQGDYLPGSDPFSYSAADRVWVNHNLLFRPEPICYIVATVLCWL